MQEKRDNQINSTTWHNAKYVINIEQCKIERKTKKRTRIRKKAKLNLISFDAYTFFHLLNAILVLFFVVRVCAPC